MVNSHIINVAISTALNTFNVRSHHGAVIFTDSTILGRGYNIKIKGYNVIHTLHAERNALLNAYDKHPIDILGAYCLVIRLNKRGKLTNSMPCEDCQRSLKAYGIKKVFYSISGGEIMEMKL
jgi:deoxycytidylate deaminase